MLQIASSLAPQILASFETFSTRLNYGQEGSTAHHSDTGTSVDWALGAAAPAWYDRTADISANAGLKQGAGPSRLQSKQEINPADSPIVDRRMQTMKEAAAKAILHQPEEFVLNVKHAH